MIAITHAITKFRRRCERRKDDIKGSLKKNVGGISTVKEEDKEKASEGGF